jgi:hypothetical protein
VYENKLEEDTQYKYSIIDLHHKLNWNYSIEKMLNGSLKTYFGLENTCKLIDLWSWEKNNHF